jgi:hypothetical protein
MKSSRTRHTPNSKRKVTLAAVRDEDPGFAGTQVRGEASYGGDGLFATCKQAPARPRRPHVPRDLGQP